MPSKQSGGNIVESKTDQEFGVDIKWTDPKFDTRPHLQPVRAGWVDEFQANLDRSVCSFERRPFFWRMLVSFPWACLAKSTLLQPAHWHWTGGTQIPIKAGARLSGKIGSSTNVGFLHMQAEEVAGVVAQTDFTVARVNQSLPTARV